MRCKGVDWNNVAQDKGRLLAFFLNGNEPSGYIKCGEFIDYLKKY
jgi:hypothetical protein